jgi:hypothetical protein
MQILSKLLYQNQNYHALLSRCFPKTLLVEPHIDIIKSKNWGDQEWADFFAKITE